MLFNRKETRVKSAFPKREDFTYDNVPKYFNSVTEQSLRNIKNYCSKTIRQKYNGEYAPNTLLAMLQTIDGEFEQAYACLEADYNTRLRNLQLAYQNGLADIEQEITEFRREVSEHDEAFQDYAEIHRELIGRDLDQKLLYSHHRLEELEQQYQELRNAKEQQ